MPFAFSLYGLPFIQYCSFSRVSGLIVIFAYMLRFPAFLLLVFLLCAGFFSSSCRKDPLDEDSDAQLVFSRDTVRFDTVFTTVGSTYRRFKAYNFSSKSVMVSSIRLAGGANSQFRLNVDGVPGTDFTDIKIRGGDSLWIFAEVTVDPTSQNSPMLITDSVIFVTNGNIQRVLLEAVGQNVYLHYPTFVTTSGVAYSYFNCNEVWTNDKPHLIFGLAIIPSNCTLTMQPGTRVHLHNGGVLAADSNATLIVNGAHGSEVTIQGDRLEQEYSEEPGQWGYIWLSANSVNNSINWAIIRNGTIGILSDSVGSSANPTVNIANTKIRNMSLAGIFGRDTYIRGNNLLVTNCAQYAAALAYGGKYSFTHCTFANYWNIDNRTTPAVIINNWYEDADGNPVRRNLDSANFRNCIIHGDLDNEFEPDSNTTGGYNFRYYVTNTLLKTTINASDPVHFNVPTNGINQLVAFTDFANHDFTLAPGSWARNKGDAILALPYLNDLNNLSRFASGAPDAGAYEGQ
ncbi:MAG: hypothetical protein FD123_1814 [Bacteroidetes bacterium]|nr:MAG: hypothetical protein FD123_1814 [Bacteroidota bacterium]